eukprot:CAMPEP_0171370240 /NCGR_PEP_ID=MMETSP0879-20121228/7909_1 /TAXON_ID=67004 /ORGANISM="Thalassiosira weissflogii, Strain CCMP1336" /LENGTH=32 /DNA_ID= /DNA_START= /DNA_END= /DNA_ORIENTATION=
MGALLEWGTLPWKSMFIHGGETGKWSNVTFCY